MRIENVRKHMGKRCLLILKNNFKITTVIPNFDADSFDCVDRYGKALTVECDMISLIYEQDEK